MDIASISTFLQTVGFPVAACVAMGVYVKYITDNHRADTLEREKRHSQEIHTITEAITNNTLVIQKLVDKLDKGGEVDV